MAFFVILRLDPCHPPAWLEDPGGKGQGCKLLRIVFFAGNVLL